MWSQVDTVADLEMGGETGLPKCDHRLLTGLEVSVGSVECGKGSTGQKIQGFWKVLWGLQKDQALPAG